MIYLINRKPIRSFNSGFSKTKRDPPLIVQVGNAGLGYKKANSNWTLAAAKRDEVFFEKTRKLSSRMVPKMGLIKFVGIDVSKEQLSEKDRSLWTQKSTDAVSGLAKMKDKSISMISSDMTIGYYDSKVSDPRFVSGRWPSANYAADFFEAAKPKLKKGGVVYLTVDLSRISMISEAALGAGFERKNISVHEITEKGMKENSFWTGVWSRILHNSRDMTSSENTMVKMRIKNS